MNPDNLPASDPAAVHFARSGLALCGSASLNRRVAWSFVSCTDCRKKDLYNVQRYSVDTSNRKGKRSAD